MPTIFTRIIEGEIPATFVWQDPKCVAFMSINPLRAGHTLVVPREEIDHWIDCPSDLRNHLMEVSQSIARAIHKVYNSAKVGLMIAGLEVPHLHIHLVPIDSVHDMDFANAASVDREELEEEAASIRYVLTSMGLEGVAS
ncbi:MAG TPA: HIT family protein [Acidimicrobiia bacterium]|jgi:histidine triad (HIT) family protein|nr:HIT family protein [Acidimicrobiia bacterium]